MKKLFLTLLFVVSGVALASAQKFALVDMEYIMKNIPHYEVANQSLNQLSQRYQEKVETVQQQAEAIYKQFQAERVYLTDDQKKRYEESVVAKEKEASELRYKYFGPEGELYQKRQQLLKPIQDEVYNAIKAVCEEQGFQAIFDRASSANIIYASPRIDVSDAVLAKLGYSK